MDKNVQEVRKVENNSHENLHLDFLFLKIHEILPKNPNEWPFNVTPNIYIEVRLLILDSSANSNKMENEKKLLFSNPKKNLICQWKFDSFDLGM